MSSTIVALSTAEGEGALAVVRLSGPAAIEIVDRSTRGPRLAAQPSHTLHLSKVFDGDQFLDEVVVSIFRAPRSYTGEDVVELSCHGSPYVLRRLLALLCAAGAMPAQAGEFTQRAFLNKKLDLTQAEAVSNLIASESEMEHRIATDQIKGSISKQIQAFRSDLIEFAALLELELDFSEEDIHFAKRDELSQRISTIQRGIKELIQHFYNAEGFKKGIDIVIAGAPNAGKSTLFNAFISEEKAIVSEIEGTTRDYLEAELQIRGTRFRITDTAGLRLSNDPIEQEGLRRTHARIERARLLLLLVDLSKIMPQDLAQLKKEQSAVKCPILVLGNKIDLLNKAKQDAFREIPEVLLLSARQKLGLAQVLEEIYEHTVNRGLRSGTCVTNLRHYTCLCRASEALTRTQTGLQHRAETELLAADLREALRSLGEITGEIYSEDLLKHIFSHFCIGK